MSHSQRIFLDWKRPLLWSAIDHVFSDWGTYTQKNTLFLFPNKRMERRWIELSTRASQEQHKANLLLNTSSIYEVFSKTLHNCTSISKTETTLLWSKVIDATHNPESTLEILGYTLREKIQCANYLSDIYKTFADHLVNPNSIPELLQEAHPDIDIAAWLLISELSESYKREVDSLNSHDFSVDFISNQIPKCETDYHFVLIGCLELPPAYSLFLEKNSESITCLIPAPEDHSALFTERGTLDFDAWQDAWPKMESQTLQVSANPSEQFNEIAKYLSQARTDGCSLEHISIGLPNPESQGALQTTLELSDIASTIPGNLNINQTPIGKLCHAIIDCWNSNTSEDIFYDILFLDHAEKNGRISSATDVLHFLDRSRSSTTISSLRRAQANNRTDIENKKALIELLKDLGVTKETEKLFCLEWTNRLQEVLCKCLQNPDGKLPSIVSHQSVEKLSQVCTQLQSTITHISELLSAAEFKTIFEDACKRMSIVEPASSAVRLLDLSEFFFDDAAVKIIPDATSSNIPQSPPIDPLITESLRRLLKLPNKISMQASCNFFLQYLQNSSQNLLIFSPQIDLEGNPSLYPRTLLLGSKEELENRVRSFYEHASTQLNKDASEHSLFDYAFTRLSKTLSIIPQDNQEKSFPLESLSPTHIRSYLQCPYTFYLEHILQLRLIDYEPLEVPIYIIGSLLHDTFGESIQTHPNMKDEQALFKASLEIYYNLADKLFGKKRPAATNLQLKLAESRLRNFCSWYLTQIKDGWKFLAHEYTLSDKVRLSYNKTERVPVSGRVDWIDVHEQDKVIRVVDFKTGDTEYTVRKAFRDGEWHDPQLGIYAACLQSDHLLQEKYSDFSVAIAYLSLGKGAKSTFTQHTMSEDDLSSLIKTSEIVASKISMGEFWPPELVGSSLEKRLFGQLEWEL